MCGIDMYGDQSRETERQRREFRMEAVRVLIEKVTIDLPEVFEQAEQIVRFVMDGITPEPEPLTIITDPLIPATFPYPKYKVPPPPPVSEEF